jgi:hypothetical protein
MPKPTLTKTAVTLYDIQSRRVWGVMSHRDAVADLGFARDCGDVLQDYATTDRDGNPLRVVFQRSADTGPDSEYALDEGGVYEFTA